jgi:hypothetical protein
MILQTFENLIMSVEFENISWIHLSQIFFLIINAVLIVFFIDYSNNKKYVIIIESPYKMKVYKSKQMGYKQAVNALSDLRYQFYCQGVAGFKKSYSIYMLEYNKINSIQI